VVPERVIVLVLPVYINQRYSMGIKIAIALQYNKEEVVVAVDVYK
jgi:hypothetical protein